MKCPYCGEEMIKGFLMSSRDITFVIDNPNDKLFQIKKRNDLELSKGSGGIPHYSSLVIIKNRRNSAVSSRG